MSELKRPERYVQFESIKPELREITEFYTRKTADYQYRLKQLNEYADALENEISVLKENSKSKVLLDDMDKPLVVVPKFFADWFENQLKNNESKKFDGNDVFRIIQDVIKVSNGESTWGDYDITDEIVKFAEDNEELFLNLIVNCSFKVGYTVEKEKLFYLKNKITGNRLYKQPKEAGSNLFEVIDCLHKSSMMFTQQEIDDMETGSYEQIAVTINEV